METTFQDMLDSFNEISPSISELRYAKLDSRWHHETPFTAPESHVYYITGGEAEMTCNGKLYRLTPGNIYFVPAGAAYCYRCAEYMEKLYIHVSMLQRNGYDLFNRVKECVVFTDRQQEIDRLCRCAAKADMHSMLYLKAHLQSLMLEVVERSGIELGAPEAYTALTYQAIDYIEGHLRCGLTIEQVAQGLQVSRSRLLRTFRKDMNVTVGRYITDRLLYVVENRLRTTNESLHDISERFGFCDQFYFSRRFTEYFGMTPYQYRKKSQLGQMPGEV